MEDMSDVFDMYLFSFQDLDQLSEGRVPLDTYAMTWNEGKVYLESQPTSFLKVCGVAITVAYMSLIYRAFSRLELVPVMDACIARLIEKTPLRDHEEMRRARERENGNEWEREDTQDNLGVRDSILSLFIIEIPFLTIRLWGFLFRGVPIGVLLIKNLYSIHQDLATIFPSLSLSEKGEAAVKDCRRGRKCCDPDLSHFQTYQHPQEVFECLPADHPAKQTEGLEASYMASKL